MSSLPPRNNSHNVNSQGQVSRMYSRFARRDPELYPLFAIMVAVGCGGAYFLSHRTNNIDPAKQFSDVTSPWDPNAAKIGRRSPDGTFKYAYRNKEGETVIVPSAITTTEVEATNPT